MKKTPNKIYMNHTKIQIKHKTKIIKATSKKKLLLCHKITKIVQ